MHRLLFVPIYCSFLFFGGIAIPGHSQGTAAVNSPPGNSVPDIQLEKIQLPEGFIIEVFAEGIEEARSLARGSKGTVFVGNRLKGKVYAVEDVDGDWKADRVHVLKEDLYMPNGVAFKEGDLYVAEVNRVIKFRNIEKNLANPPEPLVLYDDFPSESHHGWKFIAFGPDDKLYIPVGAPCNVCDPGNEIYATITRMNSDGSGLEIFARGVRNTVGFDWHPQTGELWFTDNGRDMMGDDLPHDELNHAPGVGMHFGFPYCHQGDIPDPEFGEGRSCDDYTAPALNLGPHVAALGMRFYTGRMFPKGYRNRMFIALHGSWNRSEKIGYKVVTAELKGNEVVSYEDFATGWLENDTVWGRPVDLMVMPDGSLLVSDDYADCIYRIRYEGN